MSESDFEKLLLEAVDEGLASLGESSRQAIYFHMEKSFNVKKQEIPRKTEAFAVAVEKIFGVGANFLEALILKSLSKKAGLKDYQIALEGLTFAGEVANIKRAMER
ncbi:MAG: hypothetical protein NWE94_00315 [Candidatus Bathyarchaeota archaeon]|nr:hypothetical protein [Candidatus Bathyarchaeota archaeon]